MAMITGEAGRGVTRWPEDAAARRHSAPLGANPIRRAETAMWVMENRSSRRQRGDAITVRTTAIMLWSHATGRRIANLGARRGHPLSARIRAQIVALCDKVG